MENVKLLIEENEIKLELPDGTYLAIDKVMLKRFDDSFKFIETIRQFGETAYECGKESVTK